MDGCTNCLRRILRSNPFDHRPRSNLFDRPLSKYAKSTDPVDPVFHISADAVKLVKKRTQVPLWFVNTNTKHNVQTFAG